ncbi:uncharacterized protein LOC124278382 [Haliotis rubra]|uniref:uncharacterized protein LOC124278382 n=1 Tax=Haliotis rubra TaxID=36100 RepID=UPI001EE5F37C|nr:uncharacterized protein LOC124278382 [Haliotis rubra]
MSVDINLQSSHLESGVELLSLDSVKRPGTSHDKFKEGFNTGSSHREPKHGYIPDPSHRTSDEEANPIVKSDGQHSATPTHYSVNELYAATSGQSGEDEIIPKTDSMEEIDAEEKTSTLQENKPTVNVEIMANTGSHARTDHNNPTSVEYHYIDDIPDSAYQQAMEENQLEAENDYECIAETNPGYDYIEPINDPRTFSERKCKRGIVFLVPIFAGVVVNFIAGLFFTTFPLQFTSKVGGMVFIVVNALAAAFCAPLMIRYGFRKVAFGGSVLLILSCISSSLTTRDDIKIVTTFIIMKGFSVGLLRSTGVVATVDYLNTRPTLAIIISYFSFIIGMFGYLFNFIRSPIGLEIPAILGLVAALFLQKNSQTHQNVTKLFKHPPFYVLASITVVFLWVGILEVVN